MTKTRKRDKSIAAIRRIIAAAKELTEAQQTAERPRKKSRTKASKTGVQP